MNPSFYIEHPEIILALLVLAHGARKLHQCADHLRVIRKQMHKRASGDPHFDALTPERKRIFTDLTDPGGAA